MAIAVGTVTNGVRQFNAGRAIGHVTDVGDNRLLLVWIFNNNPVTVTAITYGGVNILANKVVSEHNPAGLEQFTHCFYMVAPPAGLANVAYTMGGNCMNACSAQAWTGVNPDDPVGVSVENQATTNLITATVGSESNEVVVDGGCFAVNAVVVITLGAGQTQLARQNSGVGAQLGYGSSYEAGAAANVMTWGLAGVHPWANGAFALRPFIPTASRLYEYEFNVWDPLQRLISRDGHEVSPNEVRADKWGKLLGFRSPSSKVFASLADSPDAFYISGVTSDGETVRITPDEKLFADMLLKRITRG